MRVWPLLTLTALLVACAPGGVRQPDGTYNLGSGVFADEPITHPPYPDYATYIVNEEYAGDFADLFPTKPQQICGWRALHQDFPLDLQQDLDAFATNQRTFLESEYTALQKRIKRHVSNLKPNSNPDLQAKLVACNPDLARN